MPYRWCLRRETCRRRFRETRERGPSIHPAVLKQPRNDRRIIRIATIMLGMREIKQEPHENYSALPAAGEEDASMIGLTVTPSFSALDNQGGFIQVHTKTEPVIANEGEQLKSNATFRDAVVVKDEIEDAADGEDYLLLDKMEVTKDEEQTDDDKNTPLPDAATIVKAEEETDIGEHDNSIPDTSEETSNSQQQVTRMQRRQDETFQKQTSHTCSVCGKVFDENQAYLRHMWQNHTEEKPYICHTCGKAFKYNKNFTRHKILHSDKRPYFCDLCGKTFKLKTHVQQHKVTCHSDERPYSCDKCDKTFKQQTHVRQHKAAHHSDERPYSCDLCEKTFKRKTHLQKHTATCHSDERPYSCDLCEKTFKGKGDVLRHIATCHSDKRPYSCDLCEKTYKRKCEVQRHKTACH